MGKVVEMLSRGLSYASRTTPVPEVFSEIPEDFEAKVGHLADEFGLSSFSTAAMLLHFTYNMPHATVALELEVSEDVARELALHGLRTYSEATFRD